MSDYQRIELSRGYAALVDATDYDELVRVSWFVYLPGGYGPYAGRPVRRDGKQTTEYMHRRLLPAAERVDHINGDGLDNRRSNLRPATNAQNGWNRSGPNVGNKAGYRGVYRRADCARWQARIMFQDERIYLGLFATAEDAARAYDAAAIELYGEFAGRLNFPLTKAGP